MERTRIQLADGVYLTYLPARKFKTSLLSAQFVTPLQQETASAYALLPAILRRGTVRYPDLGALSARLDRLYGASVDYTVRSQVNDKREYAYARLLREMCDGEPYGISRLGDEAGAEKLQMPKLHALYGELLATARLELFYCGSASLERVREALAAAFATLPRDGIRDIAPSTPHPARTEVKRVEEAMDVTQGKLGMGFACGSDDYAAALMGNTLFGGSSNSKLFLNVREKLSLCYYASSAYHRQKRLITVSSGIEFQNYQKAYDEIMAQLAAVQAGRLEDWELEGARSTLLNAYASMGDSQGKLENFYLGQAATGQEDTPELLAEQVRHVTAERIFDAMQTASLDTVYFLKGKETAE